MADAAAGDPVALLAAEVTKAEAAEGDIDVRLQQALDEASEQARLAKQASFAAAHSRAELDTVLEQNEELHRQVRTLEEELRELRSRHRRSRSVSDAAAESPKGLSARLQGDGRAELEPHKLLELLAAAEDARDLAVRERDEALQALEETEDAAARDGGTTAGLRGQLSELQQQLAELQADRQELEKTQLELEREQDANSQLCQRVLEMEAILESHRERLDESPPADKGDRQECKEFFIGSFHGNGANLGPAGNWAAEADEATTGRAQAPVAAPAAFHPLQRGPGEERRAPQPGAPAPRAVAVPELSAEPLWARSDVRDPLRARGGLAAEGGDAPSSRTGTFGPAQLDEVWRLFQTEGGRAPAEEHAAGARRQGRPGEPAVDILGSRDVQGTIWYLLRVAEIGVDFFFLKRFSDFVALDKDLRATVDQRASAVRPQDLPEQGLFGLRHKLDLGGFNTRRLQALRSYMETLLTQVNRIDDDPSLASFFERDRCVRRVMR